MDSTTTEKSNRMWPPAAASAANAAARRKSYIAAIRELLADGEIKQTEAIRAAIAERFGDRVGIRCVQRIMASMPDVESVNGRGSQGKRLRA